MSKVIFRDSDFPPFDAHSGRWGVSWPGWKEIAAPPHFFFCKISLKTVGEKPSLLFLSLTFHYIVNTFTQDAPRI